MAEVQPQLIQKEESRMMSLGIVFDMDGVLFPTAHAAYLRTMEIFEMLGKSKVSYQDFIAAFKHPYIDFYRQHGIDYDERYLHQLFCEKDPHADTEMFDDFKPTAQKLIAEYDAYLGVVSASGQMVVDTLCQKHGIRSSVGSFVKGGHFHKVKAIQEFCSDYGLSPNQVYMIGDMPTDMRDAIAAGVCPIGIARGHNTHEVLKTAGAVYCIDHFNELFSILHEEGYRSL